MIIIILIIVKFFRSIDFSLITNHIINLVEEADLSGRLQAKLRARGTRVPHAARLHHSRLRHAFPFVFLIINLIHLT